MPPRRHRQARRSLREAGGHVAPADAVATSPDASHDYGLHSGGHHRDAISNERIVGVDEGEVRFRVRDSAGGQ